MEARNAQMPVEPEKIGNFAVWPASTSSEAREMAFDMGVNMDAEVIPVTMYRQGERYQLVGAMRFSLIGRMLVSDSARKGAPLDAVLAATNRPRDSAHIQEIAGYVRTNLRGKFVFGALTLNASQELNVVVVGQLSQSDLRQGFLILPRSAQISITDGQHREGAVRWLDANLNEGDRNELSRQAMAVIITNETAMEQIHQDFADASKAKQLPPSLLAVFDTRNPANRLIPQLERNCAILRSRVEPASKTTGKNSTKLFTTNQVRSFLKEFLTGSWQLADAEFEHRAQRLLSAEDDFQREMGKAVDYLNRVTEMIPVMAAMSQLRPDASLGQVAALRDNPADGGGYVCLSATGLVILGRIGHELLQDHPNDWQTFADRLGTVGWGKNAPIWSGNVVVSHTIKRKGKPETAGLRILQVANPITKATQAVRAAIGLAPELALQPDGGAGLPILDSQRGSAISRVPAEASVIH
jgi:DNA sulfur modification protein DndB